jgi:hypothetical protein
MTTSIVLILIVKPVNVYGQLKDVKFPIEKSLISKTINTPPVIYSMSPGLVITGNYLVLIESQAEKIFSVFELPDCKYIGGFGKTGRGPKEFGPIDSQSATSTNGGIKLFDIYAGLLKIDLTNFASKKDFSIINLAKYSPKLQLLNDAFQINDSIICGIPYPQAEKMSNGKYISRFSQKPYIRCNIRSNFIDYFGEYPNLYPKKYSDNYWLIYFHKSVVKPDKKKFASFGTQVKMLSIYNSNGTLEKELIMKTQDNFFEGEYIRKNALKYYEKVKATDKYIFAICENEHSHNLLENKPTLEIWDWNANPVAIFHLDRPVAAFEVTQDGKTIYFIDRKTQDKIFTYELSGLLL